ncbi:MAG: hypothetical protein ACKO6D_03425, partial [Rubrivivax sp.]
MARVPAPSADLPLLDRERSILAFNRRVLAQAGRDDVPLLERLRYVTIVSSNLDEFFEVRMADVVEAARSQGNGAATNLAALDEEARAHELAASRLAAGRTAREEALRAFARAETEE